MKKQIKKINEEKVGNAPEKKIRCGSITATVWKNSGKNQKGEETEYNTISLERNYTDKDGNWQTTSSFRLNDLPKAKLALEKAYEF